jgi:hypothetical protein
MALRYLLIDRYLTSDRIAEAANASKSSIRCERHPQHDSKGEQNCIPFCHIHWDSGIYHLLLDLVFSYFTSTGAKAQKTFLSHLASICV